MRVFIKINAIVCLAMLIFGWGMFAGSEQVFPYHQIRSLKNSAERLLGAEDPLTRYTNAGAYSVAELPDLDRDDIGVYVTYGQSNSINAGQIGYTVRHPVFQMFDTNTYLYQEPTLGGGRRGGSVWGRVGDGLVEAGRYKAVVFAMAGSPDQTVSQLGAGENFSFLKKQYAAMHERFGHVDGILFMQGETDHRENNAGDYYQDFLAFLSKMRAQGLDAPIYITQSTYCRNYVDTDLRDVQDRLIREQETVMRGPDTDQVELLSSEYRFNQCHYSHAGLDRVAAMWVNSLLNPSEQ